jgi:2-polyprenyl-3-methyl-5-hydroxy-6-metoxy-1,4-benzoquinol methylase
MSKNKELDSSYYDSVYNTSIKYKKQPHEISVYYVLWKFARDYIIKNNIKLVIDIGCGPGHLAQVLQDLDITYIGIDFSLVAIEQAQSKVNKQNFTFINTDAIGFNYTELMKGYNINDILITSFEFLEHVNKDLEVIKSLVSNIKCCFSVPSYNSKGHVRFFNNSVEVKKRYSTVMNIDNIINKTHGENKIIFIIVGKTK